RPAVPERDLRHGFARAPRRLTQGPASENLKRGGAHPLARVPRDRTRADVHAKQPGMDARAPRDARVASAVGPLLIVAALATAAHAITYSPGSKPDPFAPGKTCDTPQIASYGDYIYDWPSKYDLVFSPRDYPQWIWRCKASGYVSFPHEFASFSGAER